jgi:hypothetical protein
MIEIAANYKRVRSCVWLRTSFVCVTAFGTTVATIMYAYFNALTTWYFEPGKDHFDSKLSNHYQDLEYIAYDFVGGFVCLCCVGSVLLLIGTIYWVR